MEKVREKIGRAGKSAKEREREREGGFSSHLSSRRNFRHERERERGKEGEIKREKAGRAGNSAEEREREREREGEKKGRLFLPPLLVTKFPSRERESEGEERRG